ncbi:hypothetical protein D1872_51930 [compost metagenome]
MPKQHTFKSTKGTDWIDEILDNSPNKSDYIRELVLIGLAVKGIGPPSPLAPYQNVSPSVTPVTQKVTQKAPQKVTLTPEELTQLRQKEDVPVISTPDPEDEPIIEAKELTVDDLDARLNSMDFE